MFVTGVVSDPLLQAIKLNLSSFTTIQELGVVIVASRFLINRMVNEWNPDDIKSLLVYGLGATMVLWPRLAG